MVQRDEETPEEFADGLRAQAPFVHLLLSQLLPEQPSSTAVTREQLDTDALVQWIPANPSRTDEFATMVWEPLAEAADGEVYVEFSTGAGRIQIMVRSWKTDGSESNDAIVEVSTCEPVVPDHVALSLELIYGGDQSTLCVGRGEDLNTGMLIELPFDPKNGWGLRIASSIF